MTDKEAKKLKAELGNAKREIKANGLIIDSCNQTITDLSDKLVLVKENILTHMNNIYNIMEDNASMCNKRANEQAIKLAKNYEGMNREKQNKRTEAFKEYKCWQAKKAGHLEDARMLREAITFQRER